MFRWKTWQNRKTGNQILATWKNSTAWLIDYVKSVRTWTRPVTVIATLHDTGYLEDATTHMKCGIVSLVEKNPSEIRSAKVKFVLLSLWPMGGSERYGQGAPEDV